jgi:hypothetical protein
MTPTNKLRFVERQHGYRTTDGKDVIPNMVRILQQWWEHTEWNAPGMWRDVPIEQETTGESK